MVPKAKPYKLNEFGSHCARCQLQRQVKRYACYTLLDRNVSVAGYGWSGAVPVEPTALGSVGHRHEVVAAQGRHQQGEYLGYNANQTMPHRPARSGAHYDLRELVIPGGRNGRVYSVMYWTRPLRLGLSETSFHLFRQLQTIYIIM